MREGEKNMMKRARTGKRKCAGLGAVLMAFLLAVGVLGTTALADESDRMPAVDSSQDLSLTVNMTYTDPNLETDNVKSMAGVEVKLVQIASLAVNGGSADYSLLPAYEDSGVTLEGMSTSESVEAAQALVGLVPEGDAQSGVTGSDGKVTFSDLSAGMYLVYQSEGANTAYRVDEISTMLIAVPFPNVAEDGNSWQYAVEIQPKVELTGPLNNGKITVRKTIYDTENQQAYYPPEGKTLTFYVGLFYDESCTDRVEGTTDEKLIFSGSSTAEAVFENLVTDKTYYIAETDGQGNVVRETEIDSVIFTADYTNGQAVSITRQENENEIAFRNVTTGLPKDYYYGGTITLTKKTVNADGSSKIMDRTFYAVAFSDAACTKPLSDPIPLKLSGTSTVSATINVRIGQSIKDEATVYIAETDESGNVLESGSEFTISSDPADGKITLRAKDQTQAEIVITNTFANGSTQTSTKKSAKTGDDSNAVLWIALLGAAAVVAFVVILFRRKSGRK